VGTFARLWCCRCLGALMQRSFPCARPCCWTDCGGRCVRAGPLIESDHLPGQGDVALSVTLTAINELIPQFLPIPNFESILAPQPFLENGPPIARDRLDHAAELSESLLPIAIGMAISARPFLKPHVASRKP